MESDTYARNGTKYYFFSLHTEHPFYTGKFCTICGHGAGAPMENFDALLIVQLSALIVIPF